jgi:hypothetical protein
MSCFNLILTLLLSFQPATAFQGCSAFVNYQQPRAIPSRHLQGLISVTGRSELSIRSKQRSKVDDNDALEEMQVGLSTGADLFLSQVPIIMGGVMASLLVASIVSSSAAAFAVPMTASQQIFDPKTFVPVCGASDQVSGLYPIDCIAMDGL